MAPLFSSAQAVNDFTIKVLIGSDADAPTIPANFTVTPVATSQIDLDWDASSDNVSVGGYQVFRDSVQIATTTLTSYSDTGLLESTLYSYFITAFDTSFNYATPTASISTTTLTSVATSTPPTTSSGDAGTLLQDIEISNLLYVPTQSEIDISFETNIYTRVVIRWGRTSSFESGSIASGVFKKEHRTVIDNLEPGTLYEIEISLTNQSGTKEFKSVISAETESGPDIEPPPNVLGLAVSLKESGADLSWANPVVEDFSHVRVLSSDYFYPSHTADGWLVYDGTDENVFDDRDIPDGSIRYYTVFVYDTSGNISSGAVTHIVRGEVETIESVSSTTQILAFNDIDFIQQATKRLIFDNKVTLRAEDSTLVSMPYELLPEHLKTIVVTLHHPEDPEKTFAFLLRINSQKTAYEARIAPLVEAGDYTTHIEVYDFDTQTTHTATGTVVVVESTSDLAKTSGGIFLIFELWQDYSYVVWILLAMLLLLLGYKQLGGRTREDNAL